MRKRLRLGIATLAAAGAAAVPALAASTDAAQREPMTRQPAVSCDSVTPGTPTDSFAVIKLNNDGTMSAEVGLRGAVRNETYRVFVTETGSPLCLVEVGTIQTNGQGDGDAHVFARIFPGATGAYVAVGLGRVDAQATSVFALGSK